MKHEEKRCRSVQGDMRTILFEREAMQGAMLSIICERDAVWGCSRKH